MNTEKSIPFRQPENVGHCALYALANLFYSNRFLSLIKMDQFEGDRITDMDQAVRHNVQEFCLNALFCTSYEMAIQNRLTDKSVLEYKWRARPETDVFRSANKRPWMFVIANEKGVSHGIAVIQSLEDDTLWVIDPLREFVQKTTIDAFLNDNHIVGLCEFQFKNFPSSGKIDHTMVVFPNEQIPHII